MQKANTQEPRVMRKTLPTGGGLKNPSWSYTPSFATDLRTTLNQTYLRK